MAERRFTVRLDAEMNISQVKSAVQTMQTELGKLKLPQDVGSKLTGTFDKLTGEIEKFQAMSSKGIGSSKDFTQLERSGDKILQLYAQLRNQVQGLGGLSEQQLSKMIPQSALNNIKKASDAYKTYSSSIEKNAGALDKQKSKVEGARAEITRLQQAISKTSNMQIVPKQKDLDTLGQSVVQAKGELDKLEGEAQQAQDKINQLRATLKRPNESKQIAALQRQLTALAPQIEQARNKYNNLNNQFSNTTTISKQSKELENLRNQLGNAQTNFDAFNNELKELQGADSTALINLVNALNQIPGININSATTSLEEIQKVIANLSQGEINQLKNSFVQMSGQVNGAKGQFDQFGQEIDETRTKVRQMDSQMGDIGMLQSRMNYFFGLTNSVYLLRRALTQAFETIKELDATMTEAAVVTDFSVGDMWEKLPQYTKEASALGAKVNELYEATTLYYQQGLNTNEAMSLGIETMKMARIAGMESAEATEAMTAALRGFNLELNQTSATRVNDVYSKLAAITAADTEQIATAMTKTASIAHSANMELETTAALLAQIIETTQEAPETAGTAMKTIIARFSEVKNLKSKGENKGEDEEGEEIDVNKIQTALRTVGISMDDFFAGTEGLDSVLLKLAEKWEGLDFETQRYIATMAAGSRQQSRFIAMMSDYGRTTELVTAANNAAGASNAQFEKTLDSVSTRLNQLSNAWDEFTMGLANNEIIKAGISLLTELIQVINNLTKWLSFGSNGVKSFLNLLVVFGSLKLGKVLLNSLITGFTSKMSVEGTVAGQKFSLGFAKGTQGLGSKLYGKVATMTKINMANPEIVEATAQMQSYRQQLALSEKQMNSFKKGTDAYAIAEFNRTRAVQGITKQYNLQGAAVAGLTDQQKFLLISSMQNEQVTLSQISVMGPQLAATYAQAVADGNLTLQQNILNEAKAREIALNKGGIAGLLTAIGMTFGMATAKGAEAGARTKNFWAILKEQLAQKGLNKAMLKGAAIVGTYIALIVLLVKGINDIGEAYKEASDAARLEKISKEVAELGEQADSAKSKLESLADSQERFADFSKKLSTLRKGTLEWKQQLIKTNQEVLNLVDSYPELAAYITRGENGELTISQEGWEVATEKAYQEYNAAVQAQTTGQMQKANLEREIDFENSQSKSMQNRFDYEQYRTSSKGKQSMMEVGGAAVGIGGAVLGGMWGGGKLGGTIGTAIGPGWGTIIGAAVGVLVGALVGLGISFIGKSEEALEKEATGGLTQEEFSTFAARAAEKGISYKDEAGLREVYEELGFASYKWDKVYSKIEGMGDKFDKLSNQALETAAALEIYGATFFDNIIQSDETLSKSEYADEAAVGLLDEYVRKMPQEIRERKDEIMDDKDYVDDGEATDKLKEEYAAVSGLSLDEINKKIEEEGLSAETMASTIATAEQEEEAAEQLKITTKALENFVQANGKNAKQTKTLMNTLSQNGSALTAENLKFIEANAAPMDYIASMPVSTQRAIVEKFGEQIGFDFEAAGIDPLTILDNWKNSAEHLEKVTTNLDMAGAKITAVRGDIELLQLQQFTDRLGKIGVSQGEGVSQKILSGFNQLTANLGTEQTNQFLELLNGLNWEDALALDQFKQTLLDLNFDLPEDQLDSFVEALKTASNSFVSISEEAAKQINEVLKGLKQDQRGVLSKERYDSLLATGVISAEDFIELDSGEYAYLKGTYEDLIIAIERNTASNQQKEEEKLWTQANTQQFFENNPGTDFNSILGGLNAEKYWDNISAENLINNLIQDAKDKGYDLSRLGVEGLSNDLDLNEVYTQGLIHGDDRYRQLLISIITGLSDLNLGTAESLFAEYNTTTKAHNEDDVKNTQPHQLIGSQPVPTSWYGNQQQNTEQLLENARILGIDFETEILEQGSTLDDNGNRVVKQNLKEQYANATGKTLEEVETLLSQGNITAESMAKTVSQDMYSGLNSSDKESYSRAMGVANRVIEEKTEEYGVWAWKHGGYDLPWATQEFSSRGEDLMKFGAWSWSNHDGFLIDEYLSSGGQNETEARDYVQRLVNHANQYGIDLSSLNIDGLSNTTDSKTISQDVLSSIISGLDQAAVYGSAYYDYSVQMAQNRSSTNGFIDQDNYAAQQAFYDQANFVDWNSQESIDAFADWLLNNKYVKEGVDKESLLLKLGAYGQGQIEDISAGGWLMMNSISGYGQGQGWTHGNETPYHQIGSDEEREGLIAQAQQLGISKKALNDYFNAVKSGDKNMMRYTSSIIANLVEQKKQEEKVRSLKKRISQLNEQYATITEDMNGYEEAIYLYGEALDLDMSVADNYRLVADNLDLIRAIADGDVKALMSLRDTLSQEYGFTMKMNGDFTDYNSDIDQADGKTQQLLNDMYGLGLYEIAEVELDQEMEYLQPVPQPDGSFTFEKKKGFVGQTVQMIRPKDAPSLENALGGSNSSGGGETTKWENPYDEYYNAVKKINAELRKREQLERQYSRLLDRNAATANNLAKSQKDQLASLRSEYSQRKTLKGNRERQMQGIESEYSDLSKYAWYDEELGQVQIDWKLLEGLDGSTDEELTERVEEYISKLEEQQDLIEQEQDEMEEIEDAIWEIYEQGKDEYFDLEDQIKEAIIADRQKEIDKLSEINDTITDTNSKLLDSMQEQLDEYRQNRDNEKTEEELSDKQRKLAYLQQDTSGANALEIMQLQEELDEATEDYTDTLIDQKISELQQQNDKAAEQRQQQIDIMQAQLDQYSESAAIWEEVNQLMTEGLDKDTGLIRGSRLEELLKSADGFDGMSKLKKMDWLNELNGNIAQALAWLETGALQTLFGQGKEVTFKDKNGNMVTGTINKDGDVEVKDKDGNVTGVYSGDSFKVDAEGNITSSEGSEEATANWEASQVKEPEKKAWSYSWPMPSTGSKTLKKGSTGDRVKGLQQALNDLGFRAGKIDGIFGSNTDQAVRAFQRAAKEWYPEVGSDDGKVGPNTRAAFASHPLYQFKTGGLADFTGPAWLDGTKSKPEYILNADQTKAFFTLVDVLSGLQTGTSKSSEKTGDNTYDIDINVETIGSDYDVEQLATTVKRLINEDARYRNNNAINLMR